MTSLADGTRISKTDARLSAYGTVDELNAFVGVVIAQATLPFLTEIQNELFVIGTLLATLPDNWSECCGNVEIEPFITSMERKIDELSAVTGKFRGFVLPQGDCLIAGLHVCRTVCRRAERQVAALMTTNMAYQPILKLLNRLSDYFFLLAIFYHKKNNIPEIPWKSTK